jgi:hypothetical protein
MASARWPVGARILAVASLAIAGALCLRYFYLDNDGVRTFCDSAPERWTCTTRGTLSLVLHHPAVGWGVLAVALLALVWPSAWRLEIALGLAALGLVLYQADLASGAAALLVLHLAVRPHAGNQQGQAS